MNAQEEFTIDFGKHARTIDYKDAEYASLFTFDMSDKGEDWVCLEHYPKSWPRPPKYETAFARTKEFLEACHFKVEIYGQQKVNGAEQVGTDNVYDASSFDDGTSAVV